MEFTLEQALQLAVQHHQAGRLPEAERIYRQILQQFPRHPDALHLLGLIASQVGQAMIAVDLLRQATSARPVWPEAHYNLGLALSQNKQPDEAILSYKKAIHQRPDFSDAWNNLGTACKSTGDLSAAITAFRTAIELNPRLAIAHCSIGIALQESGDLHGAIESYHRAIAIQPAHAEAWNNLGVALRETGDIASAIEAGQSSVAIDPQNAAAFHNLALSFEQSGDLDQAITAFSRAVTVSPGYAVAQFNIGKCLIVAAQVERAIEHLSLATKIEPTNPSFGSALLHAELYRASIAHDRIAPMHFQWAAAHSNPLPRLTHNRSGALKGKIRVGYVSPDFFDHPVGRFILPLIEHHDRQQFEVYLYSDASPHTSDSYHTRLRAASDHWQDIRAFSHEALANRIYADGIDILVDLTGHTSGSRLLAFARKPAPIQVSYLGYPATTGLAAMDYRLTDAHCDPVGINESHYSETLVRLPTVNWCFSPPALSPSIESLPLDRNGYVTFGCFNNLAKVTEPMLQLWADILNDLPGSRLLLKSGAFRSAAKLHGIQDFFTAHNIGADRLMLREATADFQAHLATYQEVDIALDTYPYHGTTTTCEALWMGAAVITLAGGSHLSRVGASLLTAVGLSRCIATTPQQYRTVARELANDPAQLREFRQNLRRMLTASPLADAVQFARNVEDAYRRWLKK